MADRYIRTAVLLLAGLALTAAPSFAQRRQGGGDGRRQGSAGAQGAPRAERAQPRTYQRAPDRRGERPSVAVPYRRPYVYAPRYYVPSYRTRSYGYPYGYRSYGYRPGLSLYFGLPYSGYGYPVYGYGPGYGYYTAVPGRAYGSVRIVDAPEDAQVFVDGYYAGIVDDYDGVFQRLNVEIGPHHIEIEAPGYPRAAFDVRVEPGQTVTYHAFGPSGFPPEQRP
jgi:hypothetical protein